MKRHNVHFLWNEPQITNRFTSAVSLHSHTDRSREGFTGVQKYSEDSVLIRMAIGGISSKYKKVAGMDLDFQKAYFVPPLSPMRAYKVEAEQIKRMGMSPMVSITDHDTIDGARHIRPFVERSATPVSVEWTVPFGPSFFHIGVHNLPEERASEIVEGLCDVQCSYCKNFKISCVGSHDGQCLPKVHEWLENVSAIPDALLVLNHPLWDVSGLGEFAQRKLLTLFLSRYGNWIHAMELNGLRSWQENSDVLAIAEHWKIPVISGGDRHGREANAVLNLTSAESFSQFALEVREEQRSTVLFLRQYQQPLAFRKLRIAWEVLSSAEGTNGRQTRWNDRIYLPWLDGRVLPLSSHEWSSTLANKPIEGPQPADCLPGDAVQRAE
jgi:hypothetical protein